MGDIRFTPQFQHVDWVDGKDRVRAKDPNGFNARFSTIESDLVQFSTVVAKVDAKLDQIENRPPRRELWLPPQQLAGPGNATHGWQVTATGALVNTPSICTGVMDLLLPDGVRLLTFRAIGQTTNNVTVAIKLSRAPIGLGAFPQAMATVTGSGAQYDVTVDVDPAQALTTTASVRYFIDARCENNFVAAVTISAFQIVYSTS
ncbi:hypothetical protein [Amycolatopsis sp. RTGN1]|uniref:hypothetical protein n=1 Tax=Amycolatopsis ponsaeliensis TaxID=2992142 RepID=UPI0025506A6E|nr:hypothetical protein [Amycolatopsis sp. RTGN1]